MAVILLLKWPNVSRALWWLRNFMEIMAENLQKPFVIKICSFMKCCTRPEIERLHESGKLIASPRKYFRIRMSLDKLKNLHSFAHENEHVPFYNDPFILNNTFRGLAFIIFLKNHNLAYAGEYQWISESYLSHKLFGKTTQLVIVPKHNNIKICRKRNTYQEQNK